MEALAAARPARGERRHHPCPLCDEHVEQAPPNVLAREDDDGCTGRRPFHLNVVEGRCHCNRLYAATRLSSDRRSASLS